MILIPSCQEIEITRRGTLALEEGWLWVAQTTGDATGCSYLWNRRPGLSNDNDIRPALKRTEGEWPHLERIVWDE